MLNEVNFLDKYKKDADALQSILKGLGLWISGVEGHWRIISKNGKDSAVAFSDRDIPFVLMDQDENIVNKSGNPQGAKLFLMSCLAATNESVLSKILAGGSVRSILMEDVRSVLLESSNNQNNAEYKKFLKEFEEDYKECQFTCKVIEDVYYDKEPFYDYPDEEHRKVYTISEHLSYDDVIKLINRDMAIISEKFSFRYDPNDYGVFVRIKGKVGDGSYWDDYMRGRIVEFDLDFRMVDRTKAAFY